eukprot:tig00000492_g1497.t1
MAPPTQLAQADPAWFDLMKKLQGDSSFTAQRDEYSVISALAQAALETQRAHGELKRALAAGAPPGRREAALKRLKEELWFEFNWRVNLDCVGSAHRAKLAERLWQLMDDPAAALAHVSSTTRAWRVTLRSVLRDARDAGIRGTWTASACDHVVSVARAPAPGGEFESILIVVDETGCSWDLLADIARFASADEARRRAEEFARALGFPPA